MGDFAFYKDSEDFWVSINKDGVEEYYPSAICRYYFNGNLLTIKRLYEHAAASFINGIPVTKILKSATPNDFYSSKQDFLQRTKLFFFTESFAIITDEEGNIYDENTPFPTERPEKGVTPAISIETVSGNVPSGKYAITFVTSNNFSGTILGIPIPKDFILPLKTDYNSRFNASVPYTINQGNIMLITIE